MARNFGRFIYKSLRILYGSWIFYFLWNDYHWQGAGGSMVVVIHLQRYLTEHSLRAEHFLSTIMVQFLLTITTWSTGFSS